MTSFRIRDFSGLITDLWSHTLQITLLTVLSARSETYCFWHTKVKNSMPIISHIYRWKGHLFILRNCTLLFLLHLSKRTICSSLDASRTDVAVQRYENVSSSLPCYVINFRVSMHGVPVCFTGTDEFKTCVCGMCRQQMVYTWHIYSCSSASVFTGWNICVWILMT